MTDCLLRLFPDLKRQTELHYIGWAKNQNKLNPNECHYPLITYLSFFCKLFKFLFKFCTTFWILHIWCYNIEYIDGSTASRRYGEERQDDYDDDGPPPSLCETQISGKEWLQTDKWAFHPLFLCHFLCWFWPTKLRKMFLYIF